MPWVRCSFCFLTLLFLSVASSAPDQPNELHVASEYSDLHKPVWPGRSSEQVLASLELVEWYPIQWFCQPRVGRMLSRKNNHKLADPYQEVRSTIAGCQAMIISAPYYAYQAQVVSKPV